MPTEIKKTATEEWLVNLNGPALATEASAHTVYSYSGFWWCNCGAPGGPRFSRPYCAHIQAVKENLNWRARVKKAIETPSTRL